MNFPQFLRGMADAEEGLMRKSKDQDYLLGRDALLQWKKEAAPENSLGDWLDQYIIEMMFRCSDCKKVVDGRMQGGTDDERCDTCWVKANQNG